MTLQVLLIEDDTLSRRLITFALLNAEFDVRTASDGQAGWEALHDGSPLPDVVVLEMMMPRMDGRQFRQKQLKVPKLAAIPTVVITAQLVEPSIRAAIGDIPVVPKPLPIAALVATVRAVIVPRDKRATACGCGEVYDAPRWRGLPWLGNIDNGRDVGEILELRNCTCGSTLAWEVGLHAMSVRPPGV